MKSKHKGCPCFPRGEYPDDEDFCYWNTKAERCAGCPKMTEVRDVSRFESKEMENK